MSPTDIDAIKIFRQAAKFHKATCVAQQYRIRTSDPDMDGPVVYLSAFAVELYLKALIFQRKKVYTHDLLRLVGELASNDRCALETYYQNLAVTHPLKHIGTGDCPPPFVEALKSIQFATVRWRYTHENNPGPAIYLDCISRAARDMVLRSHEDWSDAGLIEPVHDGARPVAPLAAFEVAWSPSMPAAVSGVGEEAFLSGSRFHKLEQTLTRYGMRTGDISVYIVIFAALAISVELYLKAILLKGGATINEVSHFSHDIDGLYRELPRPSRRRIARAFPALAMNNRNTRAALENPSTKVDVRLDRVLWAASSAFDDCRWSFEGRRVQASAMGELALAVRNEAVQMHFAGFKRVDYLPLHDGGKIHKRGEGRVRSVEVED